MTTTAGPAAKAEPREDRDLPTWLNGFIGANSPSPMRSVGVAALCLAAAVLLQIVFRTLGGSLLFATYFPAVLITGLLAGLLTGLFVTVAGLMIVWWAFMDPQFAFFPLSSDQLLNMATYLFSSGCILAVTEQYRGLARKVLRHEKERELVLRELEHRGRNTHAVIDVIVKKTLENDPDRANLICGRIRAVKFANDLINQSTTYSVLLKTLLLQEFVPYGESCFEFEGSDLELPANVARHLALAFHELVTNSAKYGALSKTGGRVLISWKNDNGLIRLEWREVGGPLVQPPQKHGFGTRVVSASIESLSGSVTQTFAPDGLRCTIVFQL